MNKLSYFLKIFFLFFLIISCEEEQIEKEVEKPQPKIIFNSLIVDDKNVFIDEHINIIIDAENFTKVTVSSSNPKISIEKITKTNYKISASEKASGTITANLSSDGTESKTKSNLVNFYEHGVVDYNIIEGIVIDQDSSDKVLEIFGEPDGKYTYTATISGTSSVLTIERWFYMSKGFYLNTLKANKIVIAANIFGRSWSAKTDEDIFLRTGVPYPHNIGLLGKFTDNNGILMDKVVEKHGVPNRKIASSTPSSTFKWYIYNDLSPTVLQSQIGVFYFYADDINAYTGKRISSIILD